MMIRKELQKIAAAGLAVLLAFLPAVPVNAAPAEGSIRNKNEIIYGILAAEGDIKQIYAVNHFEMTQPGKVTDYGDYSAVISLSSSETIRQTGDQVTAKAGGQDFYYQGNMTSADLPWIFTISYELNGIKVQAAELSGKSGALTIRLQTSRNPAADRAFYDNYMIQAVFTLDSERCRDIKAPDAAIAEAGKNKKINFTILPGKDTDVTINTTVKDFEMSGVEINAVPFSMSIDLPDTKEMTGQFEQLSDAIGDLNTGMEQFSEGIEELKTGSKSLADGSGEIESGLSALAGNADNLTGASNEINKALAKISGALSSSGLADMDLSELKQLPGGLSKMSEGLTGISSGLIHLKEGYSQAYQALDGAIAKIPDTQITTEQIQALYEGADAGKAAALDQLTAYYQAGRTVKETYAGVKDGFNAVGETIDTLAGSIDQITGALSDTAKKVGDAAAKLDGLNQLSELADGIAQLSGNYSEFHTGLKEYMKGVKKLATNYAGFDKGVSDLNGGVGQINKGAAALADGTKTLHMETADLPETVRQEIDNMMAKYDGSKFEPVSFTSSKNKQTELVQFVLKGEAIEKQEEIKEVKAEVQEKETFIERLAALFSRKQD